MPVIDKLPSSLAPSSVEEILERSLILTKNLFREFLLPWIAVSLISILLVNYADDWLTFTVSILVNLICTVLIVILAGHGWLGQSTSLLTAVRELSLSKLIKIVLLVLLVVVVTILLLFLLILPGLIYLLNRFLAFYIVILEDAPIDKAIQRSKFFMTQGRWYSLSGPAMRISLLTLVTCFVSFMVNIVVAVGVATIGLTQSNATYQISLFVGNFISTAVYSFSSIALVGFYYDMRARYDNSA